MFEFVLEKSWPIMMLCISRTLKYLLRQPTLKKQLRNSQGDTAQDIAARAGPHAYLFDTVQQKHLAEDKPTSTHDELSSCSVKPTENLSEKES